MTAVKRLKSKEREQVQKWPIQRVKLRNSSAYSKISIYTIDSFVEPGKIAVRGSKTINFTNLKNKNKCEAMFYLNNYNPYYSTKINY